MTGTMVNDVSGIRRTRLDSGLRVVTEHLPGLRSAAVGFWVGTGSRDEPESIAGASHFLEHLLFKGTETRHAAEIAEAVESCGGDMNAFTGQEVTAFYVRVPDRPPRRSRSTSSPTSCGHPRCGADEVESERQVILEEIRMRDDTPDDLVHDVFAGALLRPITRSVARSLGSQETIARSRATRSPSTTRDALPAVERRGRGRRQRRPRRRRRAGRGRAARRRATAGPSASTAPTPVTPTRFAVSTARLEQSHVVLGARALRRDDPDRFALAVVDQVLGGGMSSRLFQEVREKRGLAYSVFSYRSAYEETGALAVYCAHRARTGRRDPRGRAR